MTSVMLLSHLATAVSAPPAMFTAKPNSAEKTMSGSMALRLNSPAKSPTVKKFTISSDTEAYSPISPAGISCHGTGTGGTAFIRANMSTAAMVPVTTNTATVTPMIRPARRILLMLATDPAMDANTRGTTTQNIMLMNTVPRGLMTADALGSRNPKAQPSSMASSITARKP